MFKQIRNAEDVSWCKRGFSAQKGKAGEKANSNSVEVSVQCPALGRDMGALLAPYCIRCCLQDTSALLLTILMT